MEATHTGNPWEPPGPGRSMIRSALAISDRRARVRRVFRAWLSIPLVIIAVALLGAACSNTDDLEQRVATLESELASRPAIGEMTVVGREVNDVGKGGLEVCVRYRAFGSVAETCVLGVPESVEAASACFEEAKVGKPLPDSCR